MGLDAVELLCAVEDEFGIVIADDVASSITTPRQLADAVAAQLTTANTQPPACINQAQFYRLRSWLQAEYGIARRSITPDTAIRSVLPPSLRQHWRQLKTAIGRHDMPNLRCTNLVRLLLVAGWLGGIALLSWFGLSPGISILIALVPGGWCIAWLSTKLASALPNGITKLRDLLPHLAHAQPWQRSDDEILQRVIQLTSVQLGIPLANIHPDSHFVKDLGLS
ncbi:hypothetical protein [Chitinilyticum aquatile]|uniref:hypothetical protein n=1 Tax=Chitinilyticum aquatile TaxID=362520 RepID=UPI00041E486E|nr:hypothetical protein [Chitinilyticum aquatile]